MRRPGLSPAPASILVGGSPVRNHTSPSQPAVRLKLKSPGPMNVNARQSEYLPQRRKDAKLAERIFKSQARRYVLQPHDFDFFLDLFEFLVAGDQLDTPLFA